MKDTIKNSIIGAFAIFGFVSLISSYTENKEINKSVFIDNSNYEMHKLKNNTLMIFNKKNGEIFYKETAEPFINEDVKISGSLTLNPGDGNWFVNNL